MAKKRTVAGGEGEPAGEKKRPRRLIPVPEALCKLLDELADEDFNNVTDQVRTAVVEHLRRRGRLAQPKAGPFDPPARAD